MGSVPTTSAGTLDGPIPPDGAAGADGAPQMTVYQTGRTRRTSTGRMARRGRFTDLLKDQRADTSSRFGDLPVRYDRALEVGYLTGCVDEVGESTTAAAR